MEFKTSIGNSITRRWVSLCLCLCWIMFLGQPALSQVLESDLLWNSYEQLGKIDERVITIGKNLLEISKSLGSRDPEQQYLDYLLNSYQKTSMLLEHRNGLNLALRHDGIKRAGICASSLEQENKNQSRRIGT